MKNNIHRSRIIGSDCVVLSAWEPGKLVNTHGNITSDASGNWLGRIGTRCLPAEIERLSFGDARILAVRSFHEQQYTEAYTAIIAVYPEAAGGERSMGEITIREK